MDDDQSRDSNRESSQSKSDRSNHSGERRSQQKSKSPSEKKNSAKQDNKKSSTGSSKHKSKHDKSRSRSPNKQKKASSQHSYPNNYSNNNSNNNHNGNNNNFNKRGPRQYNQMQQPQFIQQQSQPNLNEELIPFQKFYALYNPRLHQTQAEKNYKDYESAWYSHQADSFYEQHKEEGWFLEKYDYFHKQRLIEEKKVESLKNAQIFIDNLKSGVYDNIQIIVNAQALSEIKDSEESTNLKERKEDTYNNIIFNEYPIKESFDISQAPYFGYDSNRFTLFVKNIPKTISRIQLKEIFSQLQGFVSFSISEANKNNDYQRFGWIQLDSAENTTKALNKCQTLMIDEYQLQIVRSQSIQKPIRVYPKIDRAAATQIMTKLINTLDQDKGIKENPLLDDKLEILETKKFELMLLYLRRVHSYCYLSAAQFSDERQLVSKTGSAIFISEESEESTLQLKFPDFQTRMYEFAQETIKSIENTLDKLAEKTKDVLMELITKKQKNNAFQCLHCDKKFKDSIYVFKHIELKHTQQYNDERNKVNRKLTIDNIISDPGKVLLNSQKWRNKKPNNFNFNPNDNRMNPHNNYRQRPQQILFRDLDDPDYAPKKQTTQPTTVMNYLDI